MSTQVPATPVPAWLQWLEHAGNRLPHPTLLFVWLCLLLWPASALLAWADWQALHPVSGETLSPRSLMSTEGVRYQLGSLVSNFTGFAPLGIVLVAMLGIGIAEHAGLLRHLLQALTRVTPTCLLVPMIAFAGVMSSLAADAGYVVLVPLAGLLFQQAGRSPMIGIAVAFAAVSGGFSANLMVGPVDALLAGLTSEAAGLIQPGIEVSATANYWFMLASTALITLVISLVAWHMESGTAPGSSVVATEPGHHQNGHALSAAGLTLLVWLGCCLALASESTAVLRQPGETLASSDFIRHIVVLVAIGFALCGYVYGRVSGQFRNASDAIEAMETTMASMAGYLVLMFFAAQFVAAFNWTGLGAIMAVRGADWLAQAGVSGAALVIATLLMAAATNLLVGSASAKWAVLAPVLVPMLMLLGVAPETTQAAFRVGDSVTNIITPLMPYFALVLGFARRYDEQAGVGTLAAMMLPFSLAMLVSWSALLALWAAMGWPLGF